jgi:plasmid stabilization system protein ParE
MPELGREEVRELIVDSYRVVYLVDGDDVVISAVEHASRNILQALRNEPWSTS